MSKEIAISVCMFNDGTFDLIIQDPATGREVTLTGSNMHEITFEERALLDEVAPACVFTRYARLTPEA